MQPRQQQRRDDDGRDPDPPSGLRVPALSERPIVSRSTSTAARSSRCGRSARCAVRARQVEAGQHEQRDEGGGDQTTEHDDRHRVHDLEPGPGPRHDERQTASRAERDGRGDDRRERAPARARSRLLGGSCPRSRARSVCTVPRSGSACGRQAEHARAARPGPATARRPAISAAARRRRGRAEAPRTPEPPVASSGTPPGAAGTPRCRRDREADHPPAPISSARARSASTSAWYSSGKLDRRRAAASMSATTASTLRPLDAGDDVQPPRDRITLDDRGRLDDADVSDLAEPDVPAAGRSMQQVADVRRRCAGFRARPAR